MLKSIFFLFFAKVQTIYRYMIGAINNNQLRLEDFKKIIMNLKRIYKLEKNNIQELIKNETNKSQMNIKRVFDFLMYGKISSMSVGLIAKVFSISKRTALRIIDKLKTYGLLQITQTKTKNTFESFWVISPIVVDEFITYSKGNNFLNKNGIYNKTTTPIETQEVSIVTEATEVENVESIPTHKEFLYFVNNVIVGEVNKIESKSISEINKHFYNLLGNASTVRGFKSTLKDKKQYYTVRVKTIITNYCYKIIESLANETYFDLYVSNSESFKELLIDIVNEFSTDIFKAVCTEIVKFLDLNQRSIENEIDREIRRKRSLADLEIEAQHYD